MRLNSLKRILLRGICYVIFSRSMAQSVPLLKRNGLALFFLFMKFSKKTFFLNVWLHFLRRYGVVNIQLSTRLTFFFIFSSSILFHFGILTAILLFSFPFYTLESTCVWRRRRPSSDGNSGHTHKNWFFFYQIKKESIFDSKFAVTFCGVRVIVRKN